MSWEIIHHSGANPTDNSMDVEVVGIKGIKQVAGSANLEKEDLTLK